MPSAPTVLTAVAIAITVPADADTETAAFAAFANPHSFAIAVLANVDAPALSTAPAFTSAFAPIAVMS
jgi:hypothetical protein